MNKQENVVDETLMIKYNLELSFLKCKSWFNHIGAEIKHEEYPDTIQAFHVVKYWHDEWADPKKRSFEGPKRDWSKNIELKFIEEGEYTRLRVVINPSYDLKSWHNVEERRVIWLSFVGKLATYLGVEMDKSQLQYYYQKKYFNDQYKYFIYHALIPQLFSLILVYYASIIYIQINSLKIIKNILFLSYLLYLTFKVGMLLLNVRHEYKRIYDT